MSRSRGRPEIMRDVKICGPRTCQNVPAVVDTGATLTVITERMARDLGIRPTLGKGRLHTANGTVRVSAGVGKVCLPDKGCACAVVPVIISPVKDFSRMLVGQQLLEQIGATIDCRRRSIKCNRGS